MRRLPQLSALLVVAGLLLAGCGDGSSSSGSAAPADTSGRPVASAPDATTPPPDATTPLPPSTTQPPAATQPPAQTTPQQQDPGEDGATGGGQPQDEPVRVPAAFKVLGTSRLTPATVTVPPFLAVEVSVANPDGARHVVVVTTPRPQTLTLDGGGYRAVRLPGLRAGSYPIELDGKPVAELIVGGDVGP
jgi:hypothetical protein